MGGAPFSSTGITWFLSPRKRYFMRMSRGQKKKEKSCGDPNVICSCSHVAEHKVSQELPDGLFIAFSFSRKIADGHECTIVAGVESYEYRLLHELTYGGKLIGSKDMQGYIVVCDAEGENCEEKALDKPNESEKSIDTPL